MAHPDRLGKYQITEVLGEGAMGVVYKALDPDIRRTVALKTIRSALAGDVAGGAGIAARFRNEAQAAGRLSHPGIVQVFDFGQQEDVAFIAMEFVEGHTLAHYLGHRVRFTDEDLPGLMAQVLDALHHAHEAGVWHRDIKPANIILGKNGKLKIADFGVARIENSGLTQMHTLIGTPAYMAPEQFKGDPIDRRVDLYATGVLLYTLLTGQPPFSGSTEALMYKVVHEAPPLPSQIENAKRPLFYDTVIATALAKDPAKRYGTAEEFKAAILRGFGEPVTMNSWEGTVLRAGLAAARKPAVAPTPSMAAGQGSQGTAPTHWDRNQLADVEHQLAKHVGPMATVLVRRAARECQDLTQLYAQLATHVSNASARAEFLNRSGGTKIEGSGTRATSLTASAASLSLNPATVDAARKLVAAHLGPIAAVVVKNAAAKARSKEQFCTLVADAAPGNVRGKLLAELLQLP